MALTVNERTVMSALEVALVEANPDAFKELTRFTAVSGQSWNCPALSGHKLLVRSDQEAACYELPAARP